MCVFLWNLLTKPHRPEVLLREVIVIPQRPLGSEHVAHVQHGHYDQCSCLAYNTSHDLVFRSEWIWLTSETGIQLNSLPVHQFSSTIAIPAVNQTQPCWPCVYKRSQIGRRRSSATVYRLRMRNLKMNAQTQHPTNPIPMNPKLGVGLRQICTG